MNIRKIDWSNPADREAFIDLPWRIYPDQHAWIAPLKDSVASELSAGNNFFQHGQAAIFVAEDDDQVVGRIVASIDDHLDEKNVGHFGYFECQNDPQIAQALLTEAENWLKAKGRTQVHGPVNLNIYTGYRLQTKGFNTKPFLGEPRSPEYYLELMAQAGYSPHTRWNSWDIPGQAFPMLSGYMQQQAEAVEAEHKGAYRMRHLDLEHMERDLADIHQVAMQIFAENYGFSRLSLKEFQQVYQSLIFIYQKHPELLVIFYHGDEPVGFGYIYPDYGPFFQAADGDIEYMVNFGDAQAQGMVLHTFGIVKEHRGSNIAYSMFHLGFQDMIARKFTYAIGALAKKGRTAYDQMGQPSRSYAICARELV